LRAMLRLLFFINYLLSIYLVVLFAAAILSWLIVFNVVNTRHPVVSMIAEFLYRVTEPVLRPIRNFLPNFGPIDISFIVLILIIYFIQMVVIGSLEDALRY
jgi:YggT family protein